MVQYDHGTRPTRWSYWKLRGCDDIEPKQMRIGLTAAGIDPSRLSTARLKYLTSREERGMLLYEKCSPIELRSFCNQRNIVISESNDEEDVIRALEAADELETFNHFMDLPRDIRYQIYNISFELFLDPRFEFKPWPPKYGPRFWRDTIVQYTERAYCAPPAIARVSRLLRLESMPLFYERPCRFDGSRWMD